MSRYIDAEKLHYSRIRIMHEDGTIGGYNAVVMSAEIKDAPTADVEEIRHGEWRLIEEDVDGNGNNQYRCSLCEAGELHAPFVIVPYCWECGAKMDKEKEE